MASTFSDLGIELMSTGENAGTWGDKTNTNLQIVEKAIAGYVEVAVTSGGTKELTITDGTTTESDSVARHAVIKLTGTISGNSIVTVPDSIEKVYIVTNGTSGAYTVQFKTASGSGVTFGLSEKTSKLLYSDGTNIVDAGFSGGTDLDGNELILDADADTSITADTDDQIDIKIAGADDFQFTANTFTAQSGSSIVVPDGGLTFGSTAITSTAAELNLLDGVSGLVQADLTKLAAVDSTAAELNILDGVTSTAAELNILDGVTSTAAELNILDGVTSTAAELNILDGVTSTAAEINLLDGATVVIPGKVTGTNFTNSLLIGHSTTGTLSSASGNTGVGIASLDAVTSGTDNTSLGHNAGSGITTAVRNTFIGKDAGGVISVASDNVAVGADALAGTGTGSSSSFNVAIGSQAMTVSNGARFSVAIGKDSMRQLQSGDYNIAIGAESAENLTTGQGNVIIGTNIDAPSATGDRQLVIAGYAGDNTTTWITGDSSGNLTFPAEVSAVSLDISGDVDVDGTLETDALSIASTAVTSTAAELNILDGVTSTAAELNILDGVTSTAAELNILDGVTSTAAEINLLDGATVVIPGKVGGTNFLDSLLIGHSTTGTLNNANYNTGVGTGALDALTSGDSNTALGNIAGSTITSGFGNVALGDGSLPNVTSTLSNVGVGYQAGKNGTGNRNIYIGENAGRHHSSGDGKVIIGGGDLGTTGNTNSRVLEIHGYDGSTRTTWITGDSSGNLTFPAEVAAVSLDISGDVDVDGTLEADAITVNGTALASVIAGTTVSTATVATTVTITDNESTNENNAIIFTAGGDLDGGNLGLESDGDLTYNPSTGTLSATNISVSGTFTTVNSVTMNANNAVVFEGSTADAHETTLTSIDATGDRTISLPNVSGTLPVLAAASATQISSTPEELNLLDGKDATHLAVPGKLEGTNFANSLLVGHSTTGTLNDANRDVGVGIGSLDAIQNGDDNTAVGYNSGSSLTSGGSNTMIGNEANSSGNPAGSTSLGYQALKVNAGTNNIGLGRQAGKNITSGSGNVIIGVVDAAAADSARTLKIAGNDGSTTTTWISGDSSGNLVTSGDVTLANDKKVIFGDAGENIVGDGTNLTMSSSGTITINSTANVTQFKSGSTAFLQFQNDSGSAWIRNTNGNGDIKFVGNDSDVGTIQALVLDMSEGGAATFNSTVTTTGLVIGSTAVTSTAAELNILDGVTSTAAELNILDGVTSTAAELNILDGVTSTAAELNILDGVTSTAAELNILDGVTSTAAELNILDGVTSTAAELNILDGVTSTAAELNILDGATVVVGEINALDLGSTAIGTAIASKAVILDSNKDYTGLRNVTLSGELDAGSLDVSGNADIDGTLETDALSINGTTITSTAAELNILDGVTSTAAELNILDGVTSTAAELNILDGVTSTAAELNIMDGGTSATSTTIADADRVVLNDNGTMKQVAVTDVKTYIGGGTSWQAVKTGNFTAAAGQGVFCNTTSASFTLTLPAGSIGDEVSFIDYAGTFDSNALTIASNGSEKIAGSTDNLTVSVERAANTLVFTDGTQGWLLKNK